MRFTIKTCNNLWKYFTNHSHFVFYGNATICYRILSLLSRLQRIRKGKNSIYSIRRTNLSQKCGKKELKNSINKWI